LGNATPLVLAPSLVGIDTLAGHTVVGIGIAEQPDIVDIAGDIDLIVWKQIARQPLRKAENHSQHRS